jgi:general secretion pathway protein I
MSAQRRVTRFVRGARQRQSHGFTLIEVLVALAILAVALAAAVRSASIAADGTLELKEHLLGTWVAQDQLALYATQRIWPDIGARQGNAEQAGIGFVWKATISGTPNPRFRRVEVQVFAARAPARAVATVVGFAVRS